MRFFKKPIFIVTTVIAVIILGGYFIFAGDKKNETEFITVKKGSILQEVSVVGNVRPVRSVDLAFEKSGKISLVLVDVGNYVSSGATLVGQDNSELY
ncbi:MAG: efflux RND transporter periplasmic adaptor subunit, partial [Patescibacteria group bacterium]